MRPWAVVALVAAISVPVAVTATAGVASPKRLHAHCPSAARIAHLPRYRGGGLLRADLNGDGHADKVSIRVDRSAPARCAVYLRVSTSGRVHSLALRGLGGDFGKADWNAPLRYFQYGLASVKAIVDLGGPGNLVVLGRQQGASNLLVSFVGLSHGSLRIAPLSLSLGGSVMWMQSASCRRGGAVRQWGIGPAGGWSKKHPNRWALSIDTYRRHGWRFDAVAHRTVKGSEKRVWRAAKRAGLPSRDLAGCSVARDPQFQ